MIPTNRSSPGQPGLSVSVLSQNNEHTFAEDFHGAYTDFLVSISDFSSLRAHSVGEMMAKVRGVVGRRKLGRLHILGHGMPNFAEIGSDTIYAHEARRWIPVFAPLRPLFEPGAFVHLHHCYVGQSKDILISLAQGFGVPVYGGQDQENPILGYNMGKFGCGTPDGKHLLNLARPR